MESRFDLYEADCLAAIDVIKGKTERYLPNSRGEEQKKLVREIERSNQDALGMLRIMKEEIQREPISERSALRGRLTSCQRALDALMTRVAHITRHMNDLDDMETAQRAKLMQGTHALERASGSVQRSNQIAAETDEIAVGIVDELGQQGESLERTHDRLHGMQGALDKSSTIMRTMAFRVMTNRLIMAVIIFAELGILAGVIYWKFFSKKKK